MTREQIIENLEYLIQFLPSKGIYAGETLTCAIAALRGPVTDPDTGLKGCWHCRNIEAHHIEYVIAVKAKGGTPMNTPVDCPYHYCPACGRKLEVEG